MNRFISRWFGGFQRVAACFVVTVCAATSRAADTPAPSVSDSPAGRPPAGHAIAVTDKISISVFGEDGLSTIARVDSKGSVNLKLVGEVVVAGKTIAEAQKAIESAYRDQRFLKFPQVTINIEEYAERWVSIDGMVRNPGRIPLPIDASMTVLDLVAKAGGLLDTARGTAITVTRIMPNGEKKTQVVDVESLLKGRDKAKASDNSLILQPGDIVYVPQKLI
jgi:polysaccharide export outer membrane protein